MPVAKQGKRITIKAFAKPPKLPPNFYESTSKQLLEATSSILRLGHQQDPPALQHCYTSVVNLVSHKFGPRLYHDLVQELQESCRFVLPAEGRDRDTTDLLAFLAVQYPKYVDYLLLVRHVFLALDRPYVWESTTTTTTASTTSNKDPYNHTPRDAPTTSPPTTMNGHAIKRTSQTTTILEVGLQQFYLRLCELGWDTDAYNSWWKLLWESFMEHSHAQNLQQPSSMILGLLESTMNLWKDLGVARSIIHQTQPLLQSSLQHLSMEWQAKQPYLAEAFLQHVYQQWQFVSTQWNFLPKTWLRALLEQFLLEPHLNAEYLLKSLDITHHEHCQHLWFLASRIDGGLPRVLDAQQPTAKLVIGGLLQLHEQLCALRAIVGEIPLKPAWADVLNHTPLVAEWLAKYIDLEFKNLKSETSLEPLLYLFAHMQAKDIFEAFYKKDLAKRLLMNRVQSMDLERQFVSLLKTECGAGYTSKMEGMFQDMEWSRESLARYRESPEYLSMRGNRESPAVDMEVQILTTGYWPVYTQYKIW
ncbi:cullin-like protein [Fragilaria crotonensis]|nr:cullin-like protein [Fragilaria crotonensis]